MDAVQYRLVGGLLCAERVYIHEACAARISGGCERLAGKCEGDGRRGAELDMCEGCGEGGG